MAAPDQRVFIAKQLYDARVIPNPTPPPSARGNLSSCKDPAEKTWEITAEVVAGSVFIAKQLYDAQVIPNLNPTPPPAR